MVSYQKWTQVAFEEARSQGLEPSQQGNQEVISVAAEVWQDRKAELSAATIPEARRVAEEEIAVQ